MEQHDDALMGGSMFCDVDYAQPDVRADVLRWGEWMGQQFPIGGMRLDACKHISEDFLRDFVRHLSYSVGQDWFFVAEYWDGNVEVLSRLVRLFRGRVSFFDVQLVYNLSAASKLPRRYDLRKIFRGTLCTRHPRNAVVSRIVNPLLSS